jgi:serine/threonine-protein kinase
MPGFYVQLREVTVGEYAEFLADPETRAEIDASSEPIRFPRDPTTAREGGHWKRVEGVHRPLPGEELGSPIYGVSRDDASAYAAWWGRRERVAERGLEAALPTHPEWVLACGALPNRPFVFGAHFRPRFVSSCYARATPGIEPVLSYPVDESPAGVRDLAGSMMEWVAGDYVGTLGRLCGGSWARAKPEDFQIFASRALRPDIAYGESGFRLVLRPIEETR